MRITTQPAWSMGPVAIATAGSNGRTMRRLQLARLKRGIDACLCVRASKIRRE
jgi:hypothetical protein